MALLRDVVCWPLTLLGLAISGQQLRAQGLPLEEQISLYTAAIRANAALHQFDRARPQLFLVTVADSAVSPSSVRGSHLLGSPLDSALVQALVDSGVVAGVCHPLSPQRCEGRQRGLGVWLQPIQVLPNGFAWVGLSIRPMQAERDNTYLIDSERGLPWRFRRVDGRWQLDMPYARPREAVPHN